MNVDRRTPGGTMSTTLKSPLSHRQAEGIARKRGGTSLSLSHSLSTVDCRPLEQINVSRWQRRKARSKRTDGASGSARACARTPCWSYVYHLDEWRKTCVACVETFGDLQFRGRSAFKGQSAMVGQRARTLKMLVRSSLRIERWAAKYRLWHRPASADRFWQCHMI